MRWMIFQTENNMRRIQYDLSRMVSDLTAGERDAVRDCLRIIARKLLFRPDHGKRLESRLLQGNCFFGRVTRNGWRAD